MRTPPAGTVPRERLVGRRHHHPQRRRVPVAASRCRSPPSCSSRGRHRYDVFCAVCHGVLGDGDSMVAHNMSIRPPPSLVALTGKPAGFFFTAITEGYGLMPYLLRWRRRAVGGGRLRAGAPALAGHPHPGTAARRARRLREGQTWAQSRSQRRAVTSPRTVSGPPEVRSAGAWAWASSAAGDGPPRLAGGAPQQATVLDAYLAAFVYWPGIARRGDHGLPLATRRPPSGSWSRRVLESLPTAFRSSSCSSSPSRSGCRPLPLGAARRSSPGRTGSGSSPPLTRRPG